MIIRKNWKNRNKIIGTSGRKSKAKTEEKVVEKTDKQKDRNIKQKM